MSGFWSGRVAPGCCKMLPEGAARCLCRARVQGTVVKGLSASWELGCCYREVLSECSVRYEAWVLSLWGVAARCRWQCGRWALMKMTLAPNQTRTVFGCRLKVPFAIWGLC